MKEAMTQDKELHTRQAGTALAETPGEPASARLVYLLSRYPAVSHTFFLNEVRALKALGFQIDVASINEADRARASMSPEEAEESDATFYVKAAGIVAAIRVAFITLLMRPGVFFRGLLFSLRLGRAGVSTMFYSIFYFAEALMLGDWMRERNQRHFHIHFCGPVATVGMIASIAWRIPYSLTVHGPDEFFDVEKFYLREKIENASFIICISNFCRSQLMRCSDPKHWDKMHVVRLGVDPAKFSASSCDRSATEAVEILCVGRLVPAKGQLILLQAAAQLEAQGFAIRVRLIGDGPDRKHLQEFARGLACDVIFEGAKGNEEVRQHLARADIFALASFAEGVPVALMEAMAMQVPCVSTTIAGIPELIRDGLDGLLVPPSSSDALASALVRLIKDPALRRSLGIAGSARVGQNYNLNNNTRELARILTGRVTELT
jgi:colanic acid/amylovoran biosynthesis glycosyltransferase